MSENNETDQSAPYINSAKTKEDNIAAKEKDLTSFLFRWHRFKKNGEFRGYFSMAFRLAFR